ncbi:MAG: MarR family transcriptional regulator [Proteobacteria bacterium]|nr:MarR family transcriptional regulator [Pseudomonadota bacterium]
MRAKKVKIGIKSIEDALNDAKEVMKQIERGEKIKKEVGVYFTSFEAFRKALTPKRLELLHTVKTEQPRSINELARLLKRDIKNVAEDVKYLIQIGFIEREGHEREVKPSISYDRIALEIAI